MKIFHYSLIGAAYLLLCTHVFAQGQQRPCDNTGTRISSESIEEFNLACQAMHDLIAVANIMQLDETYPLSMIFMDKLDVNGSGKTVAQFIPATMEIHVLTMAACKVKFGTEVVLGQAIDKTLYKSLITHELAHALLWQNMKTANISREMHEYFAYSIQLALLDDAYREKIILANNVEAFSDDAEITEDYYLLNPTRFAVKSYLHFLAANNGWDYLRSILVK